MKLQQLACLAVFIFTWTARCETGSFGIYLVDEPVDRRITAYGKGDWSQVPLSKSPLISADDIVSYNFAEQSLQLKPEALSKIPKPPVEGTPFIFIAKGQRIYLGAFVTSNSSMSFAVPCIRIDRQTLFPDQPKNVLLIERAYPSASFGVGPDMRSDKRIKDDLATLEKL